MVTVGEDVVVCVGVEVIVVGVMLVVVTVVVGETDDVALHSSSREVVSTTSAV